GIRDMVYDINSPSESTRIISKLMQWTDDRQIHIHTILHQNKGDENARGHIGTELNNKAETVLQVEKDKGNGDISHVSAIHIRAMDFEPFAFRINDKALPELIEGYKPETKKPGRPEEEKFDPYRHITEQQHRIALEAVFGLKEEYGYKELEDALIKTYMSVGVKLNHKKAVSLITMLRNKRMIVQETGRKYTFMPDFHY
ncbi:mobilization protein, partial [Bacteroides uniformis]